MEIALIEIEHAVAGTGYGVIRQIKDDTDKLEYFAAVEVTKSRRGIRDVEYTHAEFSR